MKNENTVEQLKLAHQEGNPTEAFNRFLGVIRKLRDPNGGCPWDLKQTFESLKPQVIEEAYEVADAATESDEHLCEELGDLLSVIGLYCQIAEDEKKFTFESALSSIIDKLIRRHPHIFGDTTVTGTEEVLKNWEAIKKEERKNLPTEKQSIVDGLPLSMPGLLKAHRLGEKCNRVGFDWGDAGGVKEKVVEELEEFLDTLKNNEGKKRQEEEFGDLLFSLSQLGRHLGINAEVATQLANEKFIRRFKALEVIAAKQTGSEEVKLQDYSQEKLEEWWGLVKLAE